MISLTCAKSAMSIKSRVTFAMSSSVPPAAAATAFRLANTWRVCASVPSRRLPVAGSSPICPDRYTVPPARIACEYGPIAAGAVALWIACLLMSYLLARCTLVRVACQCSTASRQYSLSVLDLVSRLDPGVDSPEQRANALEADLPEFLRNLDRGGFVRTGAVDDDFAVDRHSIEALADLLHVDRKGTRNTAGRGLRKRRAHIDERLHLVLVEQLAQLVDRDAIHPQLLDENVAPKPLDEDPEHETQDHQHHAVFAERRELRHDVGDRVAEEVAEPDAHADPERRAHGIEGDELEVVQANRTGQRRGHRSEAGDEFGEQHRRRAEALEDRFGLPNAGVLRQRDATQGAQDAHAEAAPRRVPAGVRDERTQHPDADQLIDRCSPGRGQRAGHHQRRIRRQRQPGLQREDVEEHEAQAVLLNKRDQMIHEYTSRRADTEQQLLGRSMPLSTSAPITSGHELSRDEKREFTPQRRMAILLPLRGRSSAGRARRSQCRGRGFDPLRLHHQYSGRRLFVGLVFSPWPR